MNRRAYSRLRRLARMLLPALALVTAFVSTFLSNCSAAAQSQDTENEIVANLAGGRVIIGFAPNHYGPEVWTVEYRIQQEQVGVRAEYWQTRILRPRFTQLYPPEKHAPRTIVEARYPSNVKAPTVMEMIQGNDPRVAQ